MGEHHFTLLSHLSRLVCHVHDVFSRARLAHYFQWAQSEIYSVNIKTLVKQSSRSRFMFAYS